jgi:hypothetical protein
MNKKLKRMLWCSGMLMAGILPIGMIAHPRPISTQQPTPAQDMRAPDHVIYDAFFHYVVALKDDATDLERSGKSGESLRNYVQVRAGLDYEQARLLDAIASSCVKEVEQQDRDARAVIEKFKAQFPGGRVPKGARVPPPPPELRAMQRQRDAIIVRARSRLQAEIGEVGFNRLAGFVDKYISPNTRPVKPPR